MCEFSPVRVVPGKSFYNASVAPVFVGQWGVALVLQ